MVLTEKRQQNKFTTDSKPTKGRIHRKLDIVRRVVRKISIVSKHSLVRSIGYFKECKTF